MTPGSRQSPSWSLDLWEKPTKVSLGIGWHLLTCVDSLSGSYTLILSLPRSRRVGSVRTTRTIPGTTPFGPRDFGYPPTHSPLGTHPPGEKRSISRLSWRTTFYDTSGKGTLRCLRGRRQGPTSDYDPNFGSCWVDPGTTWTSSSFYCPDVSVLSLSFDRNWSSSDPSWGPNLKLPRTGSLGLISDLFVLK